MAEYRAMNERARFWGLSSRSIEFVAHLDRLGPIALVFIDSRHEEAQCRDELALLSPRAAMIAFHDIVNVGCPGIQRVWNALKRSAAYAHFEHIDQYKGLGPFMGIGLAVRRDRLEQVERR
ncbi:MAG: hypothetical protein JWM53_6985 [bacterium]|nr:hypothetical protein [bacterium]